MARARSSSRFRSILVRFRFDCGSTTAVHARSICRSSVFRMYHRLRKNTRYGCLSSLSVIDNLVGSSREYHLAARLLLYQRSRDQLEVWAK